MASSDCGELCRRVEEHNSSKLDKVALLSPKKFAKLTIAPLKLAEGLELVPSRAGIARVRVINPDGWRELSWDRYVRLKAAASALQQSEVKTVLDAGGLDGAIAFFLPDVHVDVIDPATTGGSVLQIDTEDRCYDAVAAVDVLEHIEPNCRQTALSEFSRVARECLILNYPCRDSRDAQILALKLTDNPLIREHVQWELPDSNWVLDELSKLGFEGTLIPHTSIAIWLGQYLTLNLTPDVAKELDRHLIENHAEEPYSRALYHLLVCTRKHGLASK